MSGALAFFGDDKFLGVDDMPTRPRDGGGNHIDDRALVRLIRDRVANHPGAFIAGVIEQVMPRPDDGVVQAMRFGEAYGVLRCAMAAAGAYYTTAHPARWKRDMGLWREEKDVSRHLAMKLCPAAIPFLARKKDHGRAEAILLGLWAIRIEAGLHDDEPAQAAK